MITYKTSTPNSPPVSDTRRADFRPPDYGYGQGFYDNYARFSGEGEYDRAAQMANAQYATDQLGAERASVLSGLGMMGTEQSQQQALANQQVANILRGLYR